MAELQCQRCGAAVLESEPIPRAATCVGCGADLRACCQCRHYDTAAANMCRERIADPVRDKEARNFCEWFVFDRGAHGAEVDPAAAARARLEALFKK